MHAQKATIGLQRASLFLPLIHDMTMTNA